MSDLCMVDLIKAASRFTSLLQYSRFHDPVLDFKSIPKYFANKISYSALFIFSKFRCRIIYIPVERGLYLNSPYDCRVSSVTWRTLVMNIIIFNCSYLDKERKLWLNLRARPTAFLPICRFFQKTAFFFTKKYLKSALFLSKNAEKMRAKRAENFLIYKLFGSSKKKVLRPTAFWTKFVYHRPRYF